MEVVMIIQKSRVQRVQGFGLVEVLIAVGMIAVIGLLVSQYISSQTMQQVKIRDSQSCELAAAAIVSKLKEMDNNARIVNWLPTQAEITPSPSTGLADRMTLPIVNGYLESTNVGEFLDSVNPNLMGPYNASELATARSVNSYQLIQSASSVLSHHYNNENSTYCSANGALVASGPLASIVNGVVESGVEVKARIQKKDGDTLTCGTWQPIPINASNVANTNTSTVFALDLKVSFETAAGDIKSCATNATFSPGSDLIAPLLDVTITPNGTLHPITVNGGTVLCGQGISRASFNVQISQSAEAGVQYLCRLDYYAGQIGPETRTTGTGWFICSLPEAAISSMTTGGQSLSVTNVGADFDLGGVGSTVGFTVGNAAEGAYRLHVKSVDTARNESAVVTRDIMLDLTRPQITGVPSRAGVAASVVTDLGDYQFQCTGNRSHSRWTVNWSSGVAVSPEWDVHDYHAGITLSNSLSCGSSAPTSSGASDVLNAGDFSGGNWQLDGPKTGEFIVCDMCNAALAQSASSAETLWFLDSVTTDMTPTQVAFAGNRLSYDADSNSENPYVLSHTVLSTITLPSPVIPAANTSMYVRNQYNLASRTKISGVVTFTTQPSDASAIQACQPYGSYQYIVRDGCNQTLSPSPIRTYTNAAGSTGGPLGHGILFNTNYCPTFLNTKLPTGTFAAGGCATLAPALQDCPTNFVGGYSGERSSIPSCTFYPAINRACKYPACPPLPNGVILEVGQTSSASFYTASSVPCGSSCVPTARTCQWNGSSSVLTNSGATHTSCAPQTCPTCASGTTACTSATQFSDCTEVSSNPPLYCRPSSYTCAAPEVSCTGCSNGDTDPSCRDIDPGTTATCCGPPVGPTCPDTHPQGPYNSMVDCTNPGNDDCMQFGTAPNQIYCGASSCPASEEPYVYAWRAGEPAAGAVVTCAAGENISATYTQVCRARNGTGPEAACCSGTPEERVTCSAAPVIGACGSANNQNMASQAGISGTAACDPGTRHNLRDNGSSTGWLWSCLGSVPGTTGVDDVHNCSANRTVACSNPPYNWGTWTPADSACLSSCPPNTTPVTVTQVGSNCPESGCCSGNKPGCITSCTSNPINGACGGANGSTPVASYPTANHCSTTYGKTDIDMVGSDGTFNWSCAASAPGGTAAQCSVPKQPSVPWTVTQPAACPITCGQPAQTLYGAVTCPSNNCDPATQPSVPTRSCSAVQCTYVLDSPEPDLDCAVPISCCSTLVGQPCYELNNQVRCTTQCGSCSVGRKVVLLVCE